MDLGSSNNLIDADLKSLTKNCKRLVFLSLKSCKVLHSLLPLPSCIYFLINVGSDDHRRVNARINRRLPATHRIKHVWMQQTLKRVREACTPKFPPTFHPQTCFNESYPHSFPSIPVSFLFLFMFFFCYCLLWGVCLPSYLQ